MLLKAVSSVPCFSILCPLLAQVPPRMLPSSEPLAPLSPILNALVGRQSAVGAITGDEPIADVKMALPGLGPRTAQESMPGWGGCLLPPLP